MRRIGVAFPGDPTQASTWSGIPYGVMTGLDAAGVEPVGICAVPPPLVRAAALSGLTLVHLRPAGSARASVRRARGAARTSPALAAVNSRAAPAALRRAGPLDAIVQIGTGYTLPTDTPIVTLEDMTVVQTRGAGDGYEEWDTISWRAWRERVERQRAVYEQAVGCCLTSDWAARSVIEDYGIAPEKVHVVGVGRNHTPRASGSRDWSTPQLLFVGLAWERKNGDGVVRAFARLRETVPTARLHLVGRHPPIEAPGVIGHGVLRLDLPADRDRLDWLFEQATFFVMPSFAEACGIAYAEAAAAGLASIGTTRGGSGYVIGRGGVLVDPDDDDALLAAMRKLADPETARRLGALARRRSKLFTWERVARRLLRALAVSPRSGTRS